MILHSAKVQGIASEAPKETLRGKGIVLIVDDIASNRDFLVTILRHHRYVVFEAVDGRDGLAMVHAEHPDIS